MADIKTRDHVRDIKALDKSNVVSGRMRNTLIRSMNKARVSEGSYQPIDEQMVEGDSFYHVVEEKQTEKTVEQGRSSFREEVWERRIDHELDRYEHPYQTEEKPYQRNYGNKDNYPETKRATHSEKNDGPKTKDRNSRKKSANHDIENRETRKVVHPKEQNKRIDVRNIKSAEQTSKVMIKTTEVASVAAEKKSIVIVRTAEKVISATRQVAEKVQDVSGAVVGKVGKAIKAVGGMLGNGPLLAAGSGVVLAVVSLICAIGILAGSEYGVIFSNETGDGSVPTMRETVNSINADYQAIIDGIKDEYEYDKIEMKGARATWPQVLAVYAVKEAIDPDKPIEVATMSEEKIQLLNEIFWAMNEISYRSETKTEPVLLESEDEDGNIVTEVAYELKKELYINVSHKSVIEMADLYGFTDEQRTKLDDMLTADNSMWMSVLYGIYGTDDAIVQVALMQVGNEGGEPYWSWYGFGSRVEWCACFVSWCANECGYIESGVCPRYAGCVWGVEWFKDRAQWIDGDEEPAPGMIIFFDWDAPNGISGPQDGESDHTGIVERVEDGIVYTIEGNTGDAVKLHSYPVGYYEIYGYGVLMP